MDEGTEHLEPDAVERDQSPPNRIDRSLLNMLNQGCGKPDADIALWDVSGSSTGAGRSLLRITSRQALHRLLVKPELRFGELYASGDLEVYGDLADLMERIYAGLRRAKLAQGPLRNALERATQSRARPNHLHGSKQNIHSHYDLGNDFYALWLDPDYMQYTCAYYRTPELTLEQAQAAKLHHVCRKLELKPGDEVVEAGCGWGGLGLFMAREYLVDLAPIT